ncbi:MAG: outer membrane protein transport protein [Deltaproteobacteria bacterium]|nr:outer membrane protein transport protein [Deltaproteobacteria bacterium]
MHLGNRDSKAARAIAQSAFLLTLISALSAAHAGGLSVPDLGAGSLSQGAATIASPDDPMALYYNPGALAWTSGLRLLVDGRAINHQITFQRLQADGSNPDNLAQVQNTGPYKVSPALVAAYGFDLRGMPVAIALGGYPASGYTGYRFPDPDDLKASLGTCATCNAENARQTPQRYAMISLDTLEYTVALGFSAQVTDWLSVGAAFQDPIVAIRSRQAIAANPFAPGEFLGYDALLDIRATDAFTPAGSFGVSAHLGDLRVGGSFQLPANIKAHGKLSIEVPQVLAAVGATVQGNQTDVEIRLPFIARLGVRWVRPSFEVELAATWDGWNRYKQVIVEPQGVSFQVQGTTVNLPDIHIPKGLQDSQSVRLGGLYRLGSLVPALDFLTLRAGVLGETSAVPEQYTSIDQAHWERIALTAGLSARIDRFELTAGYSHFIQPDRQVRDSVVTQPAPLRPPADATIVGNGDYSASIDLIGVSISARFGE